MTQRHSRTDTAPTRAVKHYRMGFVDGKTRGRLEAAVIFGITVLAWAILGLWAGAG